MHEKGRAALRRNNYNEALIFLLEADDEYRVCNSQLLESVDNYGLLNLDIVWCYIMLKVYVHFQIYLKFVNSTIFFVLYLKYRA